MRCVFVVISNGPLQKRRSLAGIVGTEDGEDPDDDPGHDEEWMEFYDSEEYEELEEPDMVDFVVRLTPLGGAGNMKLQCDVDGWFPVGLNPRKPAKCPVGIWFERGDDDADDDSDDEEE